MKATMLFLMALTASAMFAQVIVLPGEDLSITKGQAELAASVSITHFESSLTKAGVTVDGGVNLHPNFALIGEYNYTPLGSINELLYGYRIDGSARYHSVQGGGRLNIVSRGRLIPYLAATAGLVRLGVSASMIGPGSSVSNGTSENRFGFGLGGGLIVRVARHVDLKADFRAIKVRDIDWMPRVTLGGGVRF